MAIGSGNLGLLWRRNIQTFYCDGLVFNHQRSTDTEPSHDLAHLLVAANGRLPWCPVGADLDVRIAEYNAVFVEHFLDKIFNLIMYDSIELENILPDTRRHVTWFVEEHFAPFPISAEEAYRRLCRDMEPTTISRLSPLFFDLRWRERTDPDCRRTGVEIHFARDDAPAAAGKGRQLSKIARDLLEEIST